MATSRLCSIPDCGKPHKGHGWCNAHYKRWLRYGDPLAGGPPLGEPRRFYRETVLTYDGDECLIWPFGGLSCGYATLSVDGRSRLVSRLLCEEIYGPPPTPRHEAAHRCGKGHLGCVTRRHLRWATPTENQADKLLVGTDNRGSKCGTSKLTERDVIEIRSLHPALTHKEIAARFSVARTTITLILTGKNWAWLP